MVKDLLRLSADVAEIYSPPRVAREAVRLELKPGEAMHLTTGWETSIETIFGHFGPVRPTF